MEFDAFGTRRDHITTPIDRTSSGIEPTAFLGFDHLGLFYATVEARPAENVTGKVSVNVLGNVQGACPRIGVSRKYSSKMC